MFARVSRFSGPPGSDDMNADTLRGGILPRMREIDGFRGFLALADASSGSSLGVTFWADREAMVASREAANALRRTSAEESGASIHVRVRPEASPLEAVGAEIRPARPKRLKASQPASGRVQPR